MPHPSKCSTPSAAAHSHTGTRDASSSSRAERRPRNDRSVEILGRSARSQSKGSKAKRGLPVAHSRPRGLTLRILHRCLLLSLPDDDQLSYTVVGEQWKAEGSDEAAPLNDLFNGEWDQDAGDTVQKEVRHEQAATTTTTKAASRTTLRYDTNAVREADSGRAPLSLLPLHRQVSVFDRQQIHTSTATAEQLIRSQELDYDSAESAPSCWGRIDDTSMSPKVFEAALAKARANEAQADEATNSKD